MWLIFIAVHLVGLVGYNILLRRSAVKSTDSMLLSTIMQTGIAIPAFAFLIFRPPDWGSYDVTGVISVIIISLLTILLHYTNTQALHYLQVGVYSVIYNLRIILATILGISFLNEEFVPLRVLGGLAIFAAIFIVKQKGNKSLTRKGIEWGLMASIAISVISTFEKHLIETMGYIEYFVPGMILAAVLMWTSLLLREDKVDLRVFIHKDMVWLMFLRAVSAYGAQLALVTGALVSVMNYFSSLSVVLMVVLGAVLLGERDYLGRKILAVTLSIVGVSIILLTHVV